MPATTPLGIPYPLGTDRVMDGDNAIQSVATWLDSSLAFGTGYVASPGTGPGVNATMWFNTITNLLSGGFAGGGTFPVLGLRVPRKGYYEISAYGNIQAGSAGSPNASRLFVGDGTNTFAYADLQMVTANAYHAVSLRTVVQCAAGAIIHWGMTNLAGTQPPGLIGGVTANHLIVRLLLPLA